MKFKDIVDAFDELGIKNITVAMIIFLIVGCVVVTYFGVTLAGIDWWITPLGCLVAVCVGIVVGIGVSKRIVGDR